MKQQSLPLEEIKKLSVLQAYGAIHPSCPPEFAYDATLYDQVSGFISKLLFAEAAVLVPNWKLFPTLIVLAVSTVLNAIYFLKTVIRIYTPANREVVRAKGYFCLRFPEQKLYCVTIVLFILVNLILGMTSQPIIALIEQGLSNFA